MAYIDCKLKSQLLQRTVAVKLYFPTDLPAEVGNTVKGVLTLLHGLYQLRGRLAANDGGRALCGRQRPCPHYSRLRQFLFTRTWCTAGHIILS